MEARVGVHQIGSTPYRKDIGKGLLDYYSCAEIAEFAARLHEAGREAWVAGSITRDDLAGLWHTGVDVVCVRAAACEPRGGLERLGEVRAEIVAGLIQTLRLEGHGQH